MDSEEEYEEKHGEDIRSDNLNSEKDEGEEEQEEGDGWLVPDGPFLFFIQSSSCH